MFGILFLFVTGLWVALCVYLARKIPKWLGVVRYTLSTSIAIFLLLLVAPAVQDIVGMWQFDRLCKERAIVWVSPEAGQVKRAKSKYPEFVEIPGYWIAIRSQLVEYSDADTGLPFYRYEILHTKGGVLGGIASLGNSHSCRPPNRNETSDQLDIGKLLEQGK